MIAPRRGGRVESLSSFDSDGDFVRLLHHARHGMSRALGDLFAEHGGMLLSTARHQLDARLAAKLSAEDLVQDTFLEAQRSLHQFQGSHRAEFAAWLKAILLNRLANCVRHFRKTRRRDIDRELPQAAVDAAVAIVPDAGAAPNERAEWHESRVQLSAAMQEMVPLVRAVVLEHACEDKSFREIAQRHGLSPKVARRHWMQGVQELQRQMRVCADAPCATAGEAAC
jgi:RNA polymerase sigma-70 factor (subfamily 1)